MRNYFRNRQSTQIDKELCSLQKLMTFFKRECGVYAYLMYGTLLGAVRAHDVISWDSDYDIAYLSKGTNIEEVREEWKKIGAILIKNDMLGKIWVKGGNIIQPKIKDLKDFSGQMHVQTPDKRLHIDVYLSWCLNRDYHLSYGIHGHLNKADVVPFAQETLRGLIFTVPKKPNAILTHMYGKDWKVPINGYTYKGKFKRVWEYKGI